MKNTALKKIISVFLSLMMLITSLPFTPITAAADDSWDEALEEYEYFISVKTTDDADGWNWANVKLYTFDDDTYKTSSEAKKFDIKSDIDDSGEEFRGVFRSTKFLDKVVVNIDFGGGFTWHDWSGELTVKINGTNVISSSMSCSSSPFSSSDRAFSNRVPVENYPKVDKDKSHIFVKSAGKEELSTDLTFYQGENEAKSNIRGYLYAQLADQYNVLWKEPMDIDITCLSHPDNDTFRYSRQLTEESGDKVVFTVESNYTGPKSVSYYANDHLCKAKLSWPYNDPAKTYLDGEATHYESMDLEINFKFLHDITFNINKEYFADYREYEGAELSLNDFNIPEGYNIKSFPKSGPGEVVETRSENGGFVSGKFIVGNGDTILNVNKNPNTYTIYYDKNADDATGKTSSTNATYDLSVSIRACGFTREGYSFVGWNTEPDGSGTMFAGGTGAFPNLTTEYKGSVTLYAQWGKNVLTVVLNYPAETAVLPKTIYVERLLTITPEKFINVDSASGHYRYTGSDKSLVKITEDMSVNLYYRQEAHNFDDAFVSVDPTCATDGVETQICKDCGYEKHTLIPASHQDVQVTDGYPATCDTDGAESVTKCLACGEVIENGNTIPAYGHDYNFKRASWSFSTASGELKGWATVTCKNDKTHQWTEEAVITKNEKGFLCTAYFDDYEVSTTLRLGKDIFEVNVTSTDGGTVTAVPCVAFKNDVVYLNVERESHSYLTGLTATSGSKDIEIEDYSFVMPKGNVEVTAEFSDIASNQCGDNAYWYYDEDTRTLTIAGTGAMYDYDEATAPWFKHSEAKYLAQLNIEDGITYIGKEAFSGFGLIVYDVYMADSVTEIGERAFYRSDAVGKVRFSHGLETIGDYAFADCEQMFQSFVLPETLTSLGRGVFESNSTVWTVYCYANPDNLTWTDATYDFKQNKATSIYVNSEYLDVYQAKFGDSVRATFKGGAETAARNITIGESEHGTVSADCASAPYLQMVRISAVPDEGYDFSNYVVTDSYGESVTVENNEFSMPTTAVTVIGIFKPLYSVATVTPDEHGSVTVSKSEAIEGETVEITASPELGYRVDTVTVTDGNGTELELNGTSFTMPASDVTVSATFADYTHKVNCTVDGPGTVTGNLYADAGDTVTLTVTPDAGAELKSLYLIDECGNSIEPDGSNSFTMPDCDVNLFATFEEVQYTITYQATNGTVTGQEAAAYGEEVKITAVPDEGCILKDVYSNDWHDIGFDKSSSTFIMPAKNITVTAAFETAPFSITYYSMSNGTVSCNDLTPEPGTTVTVTPNPDRGYCLSELFYHRVSAEGIKTYYQIYDNKFVMPYGDVIIGAHFSKLSYPIICKAKNGSVEARLTAVYGSEVYCNLVPDDGYVLDSVSVKDLAGNDVACTVYSGSERCRFEMPASSAIVNAVFVKDEAEYNITYSSGEHGTVSGPEKSVVGKKVLINNTAARGYTLKSYNVTADGNDVAFDENLSFTMPDADVTVTAEYVSNEKCGDNVNWKYDVFTKTLTVYGTGEMYDYDGTNMPWYGMDINRVVVDIGISYVGAYAFYESNAVTVYMADSVEKIGSYAFYGNHSLKAVHMPERLTEIDTYAFAYCDALEQLDFPSLLVYVRDSAFTGTTAMENIWCDMTTVDQLKWGSKPYKLDEFKPNMGTTIFVAGSLRDDAQWYYNKIINAGFYYTTDEANTKKHGITVTTDSFGTVKPDFDTAPAGRLVYLTVTPLENYELTSLTVTDENGEEIEVTDNTFIMPGTAVTVNATFARKVYGIVTPKTANGTIDCAESAAWGTSVPITVTPYDGYALKSLTVTDVNGNDVTVTNNAFTMPTASVTVSAEFEKQSYGITYRPAANGSISGPENAELGDSVAITVIPEQYYKLASLTVKTNGGEDVSVDGTKFIMPDEPVVVIAVFEKIDYDIVYKVSGNGTVTGAKTANYGDEVSLTVTPQTGAVLESISVTDINGNEIEVTNNTFTMPEGKVTVTAKFSSTEYSITYNETEHGTISGYATANYGSSVTVNATPDEGYVLDTLTVIDSEENETDVTGNSFTMPASDVNVTATFKPISSRIVYVKTANGAVSGPETANYGDSITATPIASVGAELVSLTAKTLSGEEIELTGNSFTMPDTTVIVKAQFAKIDYPITYNVSQGGTVTGAETANYNNSVEFTVTADTGYELTALTVTDAENNELTVENGTFTMPDSAVTVNAVFNKIDYTITYPETEKGTVTGVQTANYGDEVTLTVTPDDHCQLDSLSVKDGDNNEITVTDGKFIMPASDVTVSASFVNTRYEVTYLPAENGTVTGETLVSHGDEVAVTVTPETGYSLDTLIVTDGSGNEVAVNDNKFIMPESNATVEAIFVKTDHAITYAETANGTVTGAASANYGEEVELTVTPDKDYTVDTITVTDEQGNSIEVSNNSFIMPNSPVTVSVLFVRCYAYAVFDGNSKTLTFKYGTHVPEGGYTEWEIPSGDTVPWINYNSKYITTVVFDPTFAEARPTTTANWFYNFDALTDIQGIEYLNTSEVTNMSGMFYYCDSLVSLDLSSLDTSSVTNMSNMFYSCQNLISLDLSNFDTSNVTDMSQMFYYCLDLTTLDLSFFDTSKSPNTKNMFLDCGKLETIYVEGIDTQWQSSNDYDMFNRCYSIVGGTGRTYVNYATSISMAKADNGYFTAKTHSVTIGTVTGGTVEADVTQAAMNQTVTLTATPDDAEMIPDYTVTDENGNEIEVTNNQFRMPASDVTVSASFRYITFTVQWVVGGIVVETDEAIKDRTPEFNGEVAQEYSDGVKNYIFCGWNDGTNTYAADELPAVTADVTYTAAYTEADYDFDEPVWNWADDRSTATATFTWTYNDREYSKTVNALISFNESETHPQYTATVIFKGKEYTNTVGVYRSASINFATAGKTATVSGIVGEAVQFEPGNYSYWKDNADFATSTVRAKSSSGADISLDVTFDNETGKFSFVMPNDDISITIYYNKYREVPSGSFEHGTATPDKARACAGEVVTYTTDVDGGWKIDEIHLSYRSGSGSTHLADAVQDEHNRNIWYLTMPADRNVYEGLFATFSEDANWHTITIEEAANGTVSHAKGGADTGDEVTLTVTPNDFYVLDSISVKDADENEIAVTNGKFTMPASDVTVTASFVAASVMVSGGTNTAYFATLDEALASWTQGTTLTLISDISISSRIEVSESKTLDLNGYTLTRTGGSGTEGQVIFVSSGPLTVNDSSGDNSGVITGGNANNGGGINIGANGRLDMNGGTITGNTGNTRAGGVSCRGTFNMNGGIITNNTSANGGGVAVWEGGTFNMNGGVITNNTSANGGGIDLINGTLNIQGNPQVVANKKSDNTQSNILLSENQTVSISDELTEGASIGVSTAVAPTLAAPVVIQNAGEADSLGYFSSDNDAYYIGLDDSGNIVLRVNMTFTAVSAADATCVDDGYTQNCWLGEDDNYYADANGITQLNTSDVVIPATGVHSYGEPEWTWAQDYSTASATFTCSVGGESTTVDATITSEVKNGKRVYTCTIEFEGDTYTDTKEEDIIVPANDIYNLTVEENIDVNILIDVSGHEANGEEIEKIVYTYPDVTTQTRNTLTETVNAEDITTDANGYFVKSFTMAIAQVNEPIKAVIYFTNGTSKEIKVSVAGYCKYIIENASANGYSDKLVNLCYTALEYGKNAINYFGYEYPSDITYPEYTLPNEFNATPEITSQAGIRKGDTVTGIASTQMFIISNATMRLTFKDDMSSLNIESVKVGDRDLTAEIVKTSDNRWSVDISGIYATELSKAVELTLSDGTYVKYAATDWAKSILNYSTNENSKALAKSLYYYSEAANEYFGG